MKKVIGLAISVMLAATVFSGCGQKEAEVSQPKTVEEKVAEVKNVKMYVPDGLPALSAAKMIKENPSIDKSVNITYEVAKTADLLSAKIMSGEADIAVVPSNLAAQAYNKQLPYRLAATAGWGSLYVIGAEEIKEWNGLKGKEIYSIGKGLTPDIAFRYLLKQNGLDAEKDVKITYLNAATELAPAFISGKSTVAVMPEPMLTNVLDKKNTTKVAFDLNAEWKKAAQSSLGFPQSSLIIKEELLKDRKSFVQGFLKQFEESITWANGNAGKLGEYAEELQLSVNKVAVEKCMPRANLKFVNVADSKEEYRKYFKILLDFEPQSIGGKLPDEGLYIQK